MKIALLRLSIILGIYYGIYFFRLVLDFIDYWKSCKKELKTISDYLYYRKHNVSIFDAIGDIGIILIAIFGTMVWIITPLIE